MLLRWLGLVVGLLGLLLTPLMHDAALAQTSGEREQLLSARDVEPGSTSVRFDLSRSQGQVRALRLYAKRGNALIDRIIVTYSNGRIHYEDRGQPINLRSGERTLEIDRQETDRFVEAVEIEMQAGTGPVRLEVWAAMTPQGAQTRRPAASVQYRRILRPQGQPAPGAGTPESVPRRGPVDTDRPKSADVSPPKPYTEVDVYYGTNRRPEKPRRIADRTLAAYGKTVDSALHLGRAIVTVPTEGRDKGQINRPEWDLVVASFALRGENPAEHFTLLSVDEMPRDAFAAAARARLDAAKTFKGQALVFVHGYNVDFDYAMFRAAQIAFDMGFDGLPLVFSWPSLGGVRGYFLDQRRAREATDALREFLELVAAQTGATQIHLVAHSMGASPLVEVLKDYAATQPAGAAPRFSEVVLAAPDVLRDDFERVAQRIRSVARGVTLYASNNDRALRASSWTTLGEAPAGLVPDDGLPTVATGVETIDVSKLNTGIFALNHSTFADRATLIDDIRALLTDQVRRLPTARQPAFRTVPVPAGGMFWRYEP